MADSVLAQRRIPDECARAMTVLKFTKMQGLGNDFVVLDGIRQRVELSPAQIRLLADRRFGVGCDQVLLVGKRNRRRGLPLPDLQRRRRRGRAMRQRRALLRPLRPRTGTHVQARVARGDGRRAHRAASRGRRAGHRGHGCAAVRARGRAVRRRQRRHRRHARCRRRRRSGFRRCRWAIRTRCRWWRTSTRRR